MKFLTLLLTFLIRVLAIQSVPVLPTYNLTEAIRLSLLFFEAQRSGKLPTDSRIKWRGDSALFDRGLNGEDLSGGYYDASDFVKFGFTMAFTTTLLAWGLESFPTGYIASGEFNHTVDAIKWASDYFLKCHTAPNEFYGQVGNFDLDHAFWGRPEELNMSRPAYKIDINHPGSDLAGEVAAALAATSVIFKNINETYSNLTKIHAQQLYDFAVNYKGLYNDAIPGAKKYYESNDYGDELTWAAGWLYKATNNKKYIEHAEQYYTIYRLRERPNEFFYNKKIAGVQVILASITKHLEYYNAVKFFCEFSVNYQKKTPKGLIYIDKFGTLSHAANVAFICLQAAKLGLSKETYEKFAEKQINYILGNSGRSFLVGYGVNYPTQPHHAPSSCPDLPEKCNWTSYYNAGPNPKILYGAVVSGPDENDYYLDIREEYLYNEVSLDYNAGFQGVCAGLLQSKINKNDEKT